ncbi:MAG: hypothetical protein ACRDTG_28325 [Pseudonocardiaceae bacterium]
MSIEDPDVDGLDQLRSVTSDDVEDGDYLDRAEIPLDVDPADFAEQHRAVPSDEEAER